VETTQRGRIGEIALLLQRERLDRPEHEEAPVFAVPQQALVDERLQDVELGGTDRFRRLELEAPREHGQPHEQQLLADGEEATVVGSKQARGRPVIRIDRRVARGTSLEVPRGALAPTGEDEYYVFQLVGLEAAEQGGPVLGTVADVTPGVANDVLELDSGLLLPMVEECVLSVDLDAGQIVVAPGFRDAG